MMTSWSKALSNNGRPNKRSLPAYNSRWWRPRRSCLMCANDQLGLCLWVFTSNQLGLTIFKKNDRELSASNRRPLFETRRRRTTVLKPTISVRSRSTEVSASIPNESWRTSTSASCFWTTATGIRLQLRRFIQRQSRKGKSSILMMTYVRVV